MRGPARVSIRWKLAAAMAVPLTLLVVVSVLEVAGSIREAREVREQARLASVVLGPDGFLTALQNERYFASSDLVSLTSGLPVSSNEEARQATDTAAREFRATLDGRARELYEPAFEQLDAALPELRSTVDGYDGVRDLENATPTAADLNLRYGEVVHAFFAANGRVADMIDDIELRTGTELVNAAALQVDAAGELTRSMIFGQLSDESLDPQTELPDVGYAAALYDSQADAVIGTATDDYEPIAAEHLTSSEGLAGFRRLVAEGMVAGSADVQALVATSTEALTAYNGFRDDVATTLEGKAEARTDAATARERRYVAVTGLVVLVAFAATAATGRSIIRPLRSLTRQATDVANNRLPGVLHGILQRPLGEDVTVPEIEPVRIATRDEVRDVAEALTSVQRTAVDLAVEQAVLRRNIADSFVNLGRRNQNLLTRQLDFITHLERHEADPDTLGSLFELDHLATRMRRNAESLLVLAGVAPPRTWAAPIAVTDVIRSALGEVESYERVFVARVEPVTVVGAAAADLAHLLAELLENALSFSPPDRQVEVYGQARPEGYVLAVVDAGVGMAPSDVERANRRLAGDESFTVAPSKYLGHYVAGHLAARHGVTLRLAGHAGRGVTVTITLPDGLLADRPAMTSGRADWAGPHARQGPAPLRTNFVPATLVEPDPTGP